MQHDHPSQRIRLHASTASEVAQYDYCPLVWWHEQFDPLVLADTEQLFAQLVKLEHQYGPQAPTLPDYQVIEQLLVRSGAFEAERRTSIEYLEQEEYAAEIEEERIQVPAISHKMQLLRNLAFTALGAGTLMILLSVLLSFILH
jgi:hypothetical protein